MRLDVESAQLALHGLLHLQPVFEAFWVDIHHASLTVAGSYKRGLGAKANPAFLEKLGLLELSLVIPTLFLVRLAILTLDCSSHF